MTAEAQRQLDPEGTRSSILDAAKDHFIERGYAATSMAAIARAAGVTKSLIHHHFGSKRELWDAVKLRAMAGYHAEQAALLRDREPDIHLIEDSVVTYFRFLQRNPDVVRMTSWMAVEGDEACDDILSDLTEQGLATIREGQRRGYLRDDIDAPYLLAPFFTLVRGWFTEAPMLKTCTRGVSGPAADEEYLRAILRIYVQGLRPPREVAVD